MFFFAKKFSFDLVLIFVGTRVFMCQLSFDSMRLPKSYTQICSLCVLTCRFFDRGVRFMFVGGFVR